MFTNKLHGYFVQIHNNNIDLRIDDLATETMISTILAQKRLAGSIQSQYKPDQS